MFKGKRDLEQNSPSEGAYSLMDVQHYTLMATLFDYPDEQFPSHVAKVIDFLKKYNSEASAEVQSFFSDLPVNDVEKMRELFTRTFDVQAITTLDIGYVMFGDDYKRGEMLANLNREHNKYNNDCGSELADHLPNILRLIAKLDDQELMTELVSEIIAPALLKMITEFDSGRLDKKNVLYKKHYKTLIDRSQTKWTIYCHLLQALSIVVLKDFNLEFRTVKSEHKRDFLNSLGEEMVVEKVARG